MAAWRSTMDLKTPRLRRLRVRAEKKFSTALSQEPEMGVKWNTQRGCRASQSRTLGCLWVASRGALIAIMWQTRQCSGQSMAQCPNPAVSLLGIVLIISPNLAGTRLVLGGALLESRIPP